MPGINLPCAHRQHRLSRQPRFLRLPLLQSTEPLGKLRGQVHALHGVQAVVTYDAPYLLRTWADKAKAWDDLCLAMSLVTPV